MKAKEMQQIKVYHSTSDSIVISQDVVMQDEPNTILIHPEQVDLLVKWLLDIKKEVEGSSEEC